jgi:hypothetical protein
MLNANYLLKAERRLETAKFALEKGYTRTEIKFPLVRPPKSLNSWARRLDNHDKGIKTRKRKKGSVPLTVSEK